MSSVGSAAPLGFDLRPERTTQYEIGFAQQLGQYASLDLTGYYKDIRDQIVTRLMTPASGSPYVPYSIYMNGDFATTKGIELAFVMRRLKRFQMSASLSFQDAQGSGSFPNSNRGMVLAGFDTTYFPQYVSPLSYNNAIRGNVNIDYRYGKDDGGPILQDLGASLLLTFNSGHPYTGITSSSFEYAAMIRTPGEALNASTTPWVFQCDLRVDKSFWLAGSLKANLSLFVINLFDTKNMLNVYAKTGSADDDGVLGEPTQGGQFVTMYGPRFADIYRQLSIQYTRPVGYFNDPYFYGSPRQIRLGLRLEY
jgi:outer membrane receptor protein involved in Fe transport